MFVTGVNHLEMSFFSAASMTISIFTIVQVWAWLATIWKGRPVLTTAMYYAVAFIGLIVVGGLSGVATAVLPLDWQITETYWIVSHIHYVLVGANMFPVFAAIYYWTPKMTGRLMSEKLGKISFWTMFIGFNLAFFTMHVLGIMGMPRRIYTYQQGLGWGGLNMLITVGAFVLAAGILLTLINFFWSLRNGPHAGKDPWNSDSLEWSTESPPPSYGSVHIPTVVTRHPLWDEHEEEDDPEGERILDEGRLTFSTSWLDAQPFALSQIPEDTIKPLIAALGFFVICGALIFRAMNVVWPALAFTAIVLAFWLRPNLESEESS
jgi:cytochrome c oxidase subunit 1/cytochrome c oxidase subunit I+III